jgi:hypothetical protein
MPFGFRLRRRPAPPPVEAEPPPPPPPSLLSRLLAPLWAVWRLVEAVFAGVDRLLVWFAVPFGTEVRDPVRRFSLLLGIYAVIFFLGALPVRGLPLVALAVGYLGVLAIGRAWVLNEKERTLIVKKLKDADPDQMPDLRWTALVSALMLLILFPLLFLQVGHYHLYRVPEGATFWSWLWFSLDKTYLKALPDWSILYDIRLSEIQFDDAWGRHLVLLARFTFDWILLQGVFRLLAIRATINEAVAAVKADPGMSVRLGRRAIRPLIEKLHDPDKAVRGAAANALTQLGDPHGVQRIVEAIR